MSSKIEKIKKINKLLVKHFGMPTRQNPLPDPLDMIIATILSQNTNDKNSYKAFQNLRAKYKKWEELLGISLSTLEREIKIAGLAKQKSAAIKNLITELNKKHGHLSLSFINEMINDDAIESLTSYKGIGVKTASCVLLFALDRNVCPVDTHVHRTVNRLGLTEEKTPDKTFFSLNQKFPSKIAHSFHTNLIRLGREICKPTNPSCGICPLQEICEFDSKDLENKTQTSRKDFMLLDNVQ